MIKKINIFFLLSSFFLIPGLNLKSQPQLYTYTEAGQNNISNGLFINTASITNYRFDKYKIEAGIQMGLKSYKENILTGYLIRASREFLINNLYYNLEGFFIITPFSEILKETNWGMTIHLKHNHIDACLGTNFRAYSFTQYAKTLYEFTGNTEMHENWNIMYSFSYYLKHIENPWNIGMSVTNVDHFTINQETNPVFNLKGIYKVSSLLSVFVESWYKSAGAFNLNVNYFGFLFRAGLVWNI
ncbi:MAG: hypothetical protein JXJ22_15280 [Bacteroidales bacterium]|nr:hypothetical protein [Bacteroidales bacterium]